MGAALPDEEMLEPPARHRLAMSRGLTSVLVLRDCFKYPRIGTVGDLGSSLSHPRAGTPTAWLSKRTLLMLPEDRSTPSLAGLTQLRTAGIHGPCTVATV